MDKLFKITHLTNGRQQTVAIAARDADAAQEAFVDHFEAAGVVHGTILSIRGAAEA